MAFREINRTLAPYMISAINKHGHRIRLDAVLLDGAAEPSVNLENCLLRRMQRALQLGDSAKRGSDGV